jgi:hypothetical protein
MVAKNKVPATPILNRAGLKVLVARGFTVSDLCKEFALSRDWTGRILFKKINPRHPGITKWINDATERLLEASE